MTQRPRSRDDAKPLQRALGSLAWLGFGVALLGFLVAIERQNWFHIKPATGSARAMSFAADMGGGPRVAPASDRDDPARS